jgi:hypothetical protein
MKLGNNSLCETVASEAYLYKNILYLPHYLVPNTFVAPGNQLANVATLKKKGAKTTTVYIWERAWQKG